jgi:hypothetical protein
VIPSLRKLRQKDCKFHTSLGYKAAGRNGVHPVRLNCTTQRKSSMAGTEDWRLT